MSAKAGPTCDGRPTNAMAARQIVEGSGTGIKAMATRLFGKWKRKPFASVQQKISTRAETFSLRSAYGTRLGRPRRSSNDGTVSSMLSTRSTGTFQDCVVEFASRFATTKSLEGRINRSRRLNRLPPRHDGLLTSNRVDTNYYSPPALKEPKSRTTICPFGSTNQRLEKHAPIFAQCRRIEFRSFVMAELRRIRDN